MRPKTPRWKPPCFGSDNSACFAGARLKGGNSDDEKAEEKLHIVAAHPNGDARVDENAEFDEGLPKSAVRALKAKRLRDRKMRRHRQIASKYQVAHLTQAQLVAEGYTMAEVVRWKKVPFDAPDSAFFKKSGSGRTKMIIGKRLDRMWEMLEGDVDGGVRRAAESLGVSLDCVYKTAQRTGKLIKCSDEVRILPEHKPKRVSYAQKQLELGARPGHYRMMCWADHTPLTVPPAPFQQKCWRRLGSVKPVPKNLRYKNKVTFQMLVAIGERGVSPPVFTVRKIRRKRLRHGEDVLGWRWETFNVNTAVVKEQLEKVIFPWMAENEYTTLVMDTATVQSGLREWMYATASVTSPGFNSAVRKEANGYPPNSPDFMWGDAAFFNRFKILFAKARPGTIQEALTAARAICVQLNEYGRGWYRNLDALYMEVIESGGEASHLMKSVR